MMAKNLLHNLLLLLVALSLTQSVQARRISSGNIMAADGIQSPVGNMLNGTTTIVSVDNFWQLWNDMAGHGFNLVQAAKNTSAKYSFVKSQSILPPASAFPGGIAAAPAVWYRPVDVSATAWADASGNNINLTGKGTPVVNTGDVAHNFNTWTTGFSNANYYWYDNTTNAVFGVWGDTTGGYHYTPLTVFGAARPTSVGTGLLTGIDNDLSYAAEPGFGVRNSGGEVYSWVYRFGNGIDKNGTLPIAIGQTSVYMYQPPAGDGNAGTGNLIQGINGAQTITANISAKSSVAGPYLNIGNSSFAFGAFPGDIQEVIWYKAALNANDVSKVETYFALKYGSTLTHDYVGTDGTAIYDLTANAGYVSNIAGIGRDAANGEFDQRQSNSTSVGKQLLISTTGMADNNTANTVDLSADGQYLIWGDNGLAKSPSVPVTNVPETNFRFASIWKVQNTGGVGTARVAWPGTWSKLKLVQSTDPTFAAGNTITDMTAQTEVINGVTYSYADVTLTGGTYFTLAAFVQAPGGVVDGLLMWHKANDGTTTAGAKSTWADVSGNDRDVIQSNNTTYEPTLQTDASYSANDRDYSFNFNPFYYFDGTNDFFYRLNDAYFPSTSSAGTSYGVMYNSAKGGYNTVYGWGDDDPNLTKADNFYQFWRENGLPVNEDVQANLLKASIGAMAWKGTANGVYLNLNGQVFSNETANIGAINNANNFAIGSEGVFLTGAGNELFQGGIAEVFAYSQDLQNATDNEKIRINSYLAIKYGITLSSDDGSGVSDYMSSDQTVVWDAAANTDYNQNITGIAYDYTSALDQRQSVSENLGRQVIIGTLGLAATNLENTTALSTDGQFLVWGDNGLSKSPGVEISSVSNVNYRFKAVWKVQNTGSVGTVRVAWPAGLKNLTLLQNAGPTFASGNVATDMTANTITLNGKDYNYADVQMADGQYFTFAAQVDHAPGGVAGGLTQWYRADIDVANTGTGNDVTSWTDISSSTVSEQINTAPLPKYKTGAADYFNYNPGINFTATNQMIGNITVQTLENTNYDIFTLTKEGMAGGRFFNVGKDNTTFNGNNWDAPGLGAGGLIARRNVSTDALLINGGFAPNFSATASSIMYNHFVDTSVSKGLNGAVPGAAQVRNAAGLPLGGHIFGANAGTNPPGGDDGGIVGNIGEVIVYGADTISLEERNRVESYLAVKYGITLDANDSYLSSAAAIVWDKTASANYYNNVAGIARDDISLLNQKQSVSANPNTNGQVTIGLGSIEADNVSNTAAFTANQTWLIWGDNGVKSTIDAASTPFVSGGNSGVIMTRIWRMQNTALTQAVSFSVPQSMVSATAGGAAYYLVSADDAALTTNVSLNLLTATGTNYTVDFTPKAGQTFFTIARLDVVTAVNLKDFKATVSGCQANVSWIGVTETNFNQYELQTSLDGVNFETSQSIAGQGSGSIYHALVSLTAPIAYLRLKLVDKDGTSQNSDFVTVKSNCLVGGSPVIYPNPASNKLNVTHLGVGQKTVSLFNSNGVRVYTTNTSADKLSIDVQSLSAGVYLATITSSNGTTVKLKVIIK